MIFSFDDEGNVSGTSSKKASFMLDGASQIRIFFQIFLPLAKPIIIYTALLAFMDFDCTSNTIT